MSMLQQYETQIKEMFFYDFVFYKVEEGTMYTFCPNCGKTYEIGIDEHCSIQEVKAHIKPCSCFEKKAQPRYYRSGDELSRLERFGQVGFFRNDNGEAVLDVYRYIAQFGRHLHEDDTLRRNPVFSENHVIEIRFQRDGKIKYRDCLWSSWWYPWHFGDKFLESKSWRTSYEFNIIKQTLDNLKGTALEQYVQYVPRMVETIRRRRIKYNYLDEWIGGFFMRMHTNNAFRKLWKAGFDTLCLANVMKKVSGQTYTRSYNLQLRSSNAISWSARKLERILKMQLSKIDKICDRKNLDFEQLEDMQELAKYVAQNVEFTSDNLKIAAAPGFAKIADIFAKSSVPITKAFKYLRGTMLGHGSTLFVSDYADYLRNIQYFKIKLTLDVLFPRDFVGVHDRYAKLYQDDAEERMRKERAAWKKQCKAEQAAKSKQFEQAIEPYKALDHRDSDFEVKVIQSKKALISEAAKMHNCSAGYVDRIIRGTSILFTVKQVAHPRAAYCMLEYSPKEKRIVQNRGVRNSDPEQAEKDFVQSWLQNIVLPTLRKQASASAS